MSIALWVVPAMSLGVAGQSAVLKLSPINPDK